MFLGMLSIVNVQIVVLIVGILSLLTKLIFYFRIKTKRSKKIGDFIKSFKTWYRIHDLHDVDNNITRQDFMQASNIVNILFYINMVLFILTTIMSSNYFSNIKELP